MGEGEVAGDDSSVVILSVRGHESQTSMFESSLCLAGRN